MGNLASRLLCVALVLTCFAATLTAAEVVSQKSPRDRLANAEALLRFSMIENGDLQALDEARAIVRDVLDHIAKPEIVPDNSERKRRFEAEARRLDEQITRERNKTEGTFYGRFPLARVVMHQDDRAVPIFTAKGAARKAALRDAFDHAVEWLPGAGWHVVVLASGDNIDGTARENLKRFLEDETPAALAVAPNVTLVPMSDTSGISVPSWTAPDSAFLDCCRDAVAKASHDGRPVNLCVMLVRASNPEPTDRPWYQVQWRAFYASTLESALAKESPTTLEAYREYVGSGMAIDRSSQASAIHGTFAALLLLALAGYAVLCLAAGRASPPWQEWLVAPLSGFALGALLPGLLAPLFERIAPSPLTAAAYAAWWPAMTGALLVLTPAVVFQLASRSMSGTLESLRCDGRLGIMLASVGCGVASYFSRAAFLSVGDAASAAVPALVASVTVVLYLFGRALDSSDRVPASLVPVAALLALPLGIGAFMVSAPVLWSVAAAGFVVIAGSVLFDKRHGASAKKIAAPNEPKPAASLARSLAALEERLRSPLYQASTAYTEARGHLDRAGDGKTVWLGLCGASGTGKSALSQRLIADMRERHAGTRVLTASCRSNAPPYQAFSDALVDFKDKLGIPLAQPQSTKLDSVLQELVSMFVPYWDLLSGLGGSSSGSSGGAAELFSAVSGALRKLAKKQPVVLLIDNVESIDEGSAALLRHLFQQLPAGGKVSLVVLLCARDEHAFKAANVQPQLIHVPTPTAAQQRAILTDSLGIEPAAAERIVHALGVVGEEPGGLFWLLDAVAELASTGSLETTDRGIAFRRDTDLAALPVPANLKQMLIEKLRSSTDHQLVVQGAALLGETFSVSALADALSIDRLDLLQTLRRLEQNARIVRDIADDDRYAFSSAFMFETVREEFAIQPADAQHRPPKLVQELHARIAMALEHSTEGDAVDVYALARHYSAAGARHARKSFEYCRKAATQARTSYAFDEARRWLTLATEAAASFGEAFDPASELLSIECDEAHVTGRRRIEVAEKIWQRVTNDPQAPHPLLVTAARACYDAGRDSGAPVWFERAITIAQRIVDGSSDRVERAAGYHMIGASLPFAKRDKRLAALKEGLKLIQQNSAGDKESVSLEAKLVGSLAEALSYGSAEERVRARELFEQGLELRERHRLGDLPGQARVHGGLGRLALLETPPDYDSARLHFQLDLQLCEVLADANGESMCCRFLARCDQAQGKWPEAEANLARARASAQGAKNEYFAAIGQLELALMLDRTDDAARYGRELSAMVSAQPLPSDCAAELKRVLDGSSVAGAAWHRELLDAARAAVA